MEEDNLDEIDEVEEFLNGRIPVPPTPTNVDSVQESFNPSNYERKCSKLASFVWEHFDNVKSSDPSN